MDVRYLHRNGMLTAGYAGKLNWLRHDEIVASIHIRAERDRLILSYRCRSYGIEWRDMEYAVELDWSACHYGGQRPWFLCPACGRRVAMLYIGSAGVFACRHCYDLAYASQRERPEDRMARRADLIRKHLQWKSGILNLDGGKPKGMHWQTYWRLKTLHDAYVYRSLTGMHARLNRASQKTGDCNTSIERGSSE